MLYLYTFILIFIPNDTTVSRFCSFDSELLCEYYNNTYSGSNIIVSSALLIFIHFQFLFNFHLDLFIFH